MGSDPANPLCVGGVCVQCTETASEVCEGGTPICDDATNTCGPCTAHEQCGEAACNLFTGACLPEDAVVHVGLGQEFLDLMSAVSSFAVGTEGTIIVHQENYTDSVVVAGGRTLAFLAYAGDYPIWDNVGVSNRQLTVNDAVVLLDNLELSAYLAPDDVPLHVSGGDLWIDRSQIVQNDGGIVVDGGALVLRNSFVEGDVETIGIEVIDATASLIYSTVANSTFSSIPALSCTGASAVDIRNSIVVSQGGPRGDELSCGSVSLIGSATESVVGGFDAGWFVDFNGGDFHLTPSGAATFANIAVWHDGDPATDIDGDPRPAVDGTPDHAGADRP